MLNLEIGLKILIKFVYLPVVLLVGFFGLTPRASKHMLKLLLFR